jgi:MEDS: MEthanogen/methylotroph, DcmR Sensory domain
VNQRERVIYFHNGDVSLVTEGLSREGVDVTRMLLKGAFRVLPLGSAYPKRGVFDDTTLQVVQELAAEAKTLGNDGVRIVLDYDDFGIRPLGKFVEQLMDQRWTSPDHHLHVLMVLDSTTFRGEEAQLARLESKIRTLDMAEAKNTFSREIGLPREDIAGRKLLMQYDPQADYERVLKSLLAETASNFERTVVFTRKDSPLYPLARRQPGTKIFVLTSRVSYPKMESDNLFLLPTYDTSLVLDALNKTIEAYAGTTFTIIFDNISHFVFIIGPDRTYSLVRQALELMISDRITAVFGMNLKAHDQKIASTFENMFDVKIDCELGKAPEARKTVSVNV